MIGVADQRLGRVQTGDGELVGLNASRLVILRCRSSTLTHTNSFNTDQQCRRHFRASRTGCGLALL
jgi:hypothetical protein